MLPASKILTEYGETLSLLDNHKYIRIPFHVLLNLSFLNYLYSFKDVGK